jgi:hypothetical protein
MLTDGAQEHADELSVAALGDHEERSAIGRRLQSLRSVALDDLAIDLEAPVLRAEMSDQTIEHLSRAHGGLESLRERIIPGHDDVHFQMPR